MRRGGGIEMNVVDGRGRVSVADAHKRSHANGKAAQSGKNSAHQAIVIWTVRTQLAPEALVPIEATLRSSIVAVTVVPLDVP